MRSEDNITNIFFKVGSSDWDQLNKKKGPSLDPSKNCVGWASHYTLGVECGCQFILQSVPVVLSCCFYRTTCCKPLVGFDQRSIFMFIFLIFKHEYSKAGQYSHSPIRKVLIGASVYSLGPRQYNLTVLMDVSCGVYSLLSLFADCSLDPI